MAIEIALHADPNISTDLFVHHLILAMACFESMPYGAKEEVKQKLSENWRGLGMKAALKFFENLEKEYDGPVIANQAK